LEEDYKRAVDFSKSEIEEEFKHVKRDVRQWVDERLAEHDNKHNEDKQSA
jgi:hypothetical protein